MGGGTTNAGALPPGPASPGRVAADPLPGRLRRLPRRVRPPARPALHAARCRRSRRSSPRPSRATSRRSLLDTTTRFERGRGERDPRAARRAAHSLILSAGTAAHAPAQGAAAGLPRQPRRALGAADRARSPSGSSRACRSETPIALREPMREIALDAICRILFGADDPRELRRAARRGRARARPAHRRAAVVPDAVATRTAASTRRARTSAAAQLHPRPRRTS